MAERKTRKKPSAKGATPSTEAAKVGPATPPRPAAFAQREADESERRLGRAVAVVLPIACVLGAAGVGAVAGVGSALLVLAAGTLLGAIGLLWASIRTLSGDAPLAGDLEALVTQRRDVDELAERKRRVLRALKDLESEHALGKIDDEDYRDVAARYRDEAKQIMREMDGEVAPMLQEAERVATEYLAKRGRIRRGDGPADAATADAAAEDDEAPRAPAESRTACPSCGTSNEADATFCKQCGASMNGAPARAEKADAPT